MQGLIQGLQCLYGFFLGRVGHKALRQSLLPCV